MSNVKTQSSNEFQNPDYFNSRKALFYVVPEEKEIVHCPKREGLDSCFRRGGYQIENVFWAFIHLSLT